MSEPQEPKIIQAILQLLINNKVFVKCPKCGKSLGIFETYNSNCSYCGEFEKGELIVVKNVSNTSEDEDE